MIAFSSSQHALHHTTRKINVGIKCYFVSLCISRHRHKLVLKWIYLGFCYVRFVVLTL